DRVGKLDQLSQIRNVSSMAEIVTVRQQEALGLGHAVLTARAAVPPGESFAVLLGDDILEGPRPAIGQLMDTQKSSGGAVVALMEVPREETRRYGVCAGPMVAPGLMRVEGMVEKPEPADAPSNFAIVGRYVLPPSIWDILECTERGAGGEIQLTDALAVLAAEGKVQGQVVDSERFDTGNVMGLLRATLHLAWRRPDLKPDIQALIAELQEL
ncbi:MAG: sugar phosphate nucleotidyltransferase, partial [Myxococcota bacterium]|nr:sugar phosphate nucleotidyltransferase [Myxococcota bacterium]